MRLLSFSSTSSPQAPVLTAPNRDACCPEQLSYTVRPVLHDKNARARKTVPPLNGPHGRTTNCYGTHLTLSGSGRAWNFLLHSRSPAAHHLRYGATFFSNSTWCALNGANISRFKVQTSAGWLRKIAQRTRMRCRMF